jgi:hypothetical protein
LVAQLASEFNLEVELKNIILVAFRFFEFLHSQGQTQKSAGPAEKSALSSTADFVSRACQARKVPSTEIGACDNEVRFTLELGHRAMLSSQHLFGCAK